MKCLLALSVAMIAGSAIGGAAASDMAVKYGNWSDRQAHRTRSVVYEECRIGWWQTYNRDIYQFPPKWNHRCMAHVAIRSRY